MVSYCPPFSVLSYYRGKTEIAVFMVHIFFWFFAQKRTEIFSRFHPASNDAPQMLREAPKAMNCPSIADSSNPALTYSVEYASMYNSPKRIVFMVRLVLLQVFNRWKGGSPSRVELIIRVMKWRGNALKRPSDTPTSVWKRKPIRLTLGEVGGEIPKQVKLWKASRRRLAYPIRRESVKYPWLECLK